MNKVILIVFIFILSFNLFGESRYINAVWYNVYQINLSSQQDAKAQIDEHFRFFEQLGVNKVFFLVKNPNGRAYYNSEILKPVTVNDFVSNKTTPISWDVLDYVIKKAKQHKIAICPYINIFSEDGYFLDENPDFAEKNKDGKAMRWASPAVENVTDRMIDIAKEIITKYNVDGIQFDRVRYENMTSGYNSESLRQFKEIYGKMPKSEKDADFIKFRQDRINKFIEKAYKKIKKAAPEIEISAAVYHSPSTAKEVLQDWENWADNGWIDALYTMTYTNDNGRFKGYLNENCDVAKRNNGKVRIIVGMAPYYKNMTPAILAEQLKMCMEKEEIAGVCWFSAYNLMEDRFFEMLKNVDYTYKRIN